MNPTAAAPAHSPSIERGVWSEAEHAKFLEGLKTYPKGPWKNIALIVGTRSARQVQTHAQKYYEKVARHVRGLRKDRKRVVRSEHRLDEVTVDFFKLEMSKDGDSSRNAALANRLACSLDDDWVTHLDTDDHLDWVEHLLQNGDATPTQDCASVPLCHTDVLMDVDDAYLSHLIQVLDSHELELDL